ncbi:hypothetical protein OK351_05570 [Glutamicibacter sp. MNS18]|uniref:hypothetical protein n=1 Tax=Glutamicibacter sp. MNS18 TaxID=2989817 RepID=UPI0022367A9F|nr:hypothetical protein [Glutamicibacter sp. MNS18]MCW4464970.1 hypothetical protein [Glutamicibacter sp. MNS18]
MSTATDPGSGIDLHVEISELPGPGTIEPNPDRWPEGLADTGSEPWMLLAALAVLALGTVVSRYSRHRRERH